MGTASWRCDRSSRGRTGNRTGGQPPPGGPRLPVRPAPATDPARSTTIRAMRAMILEGTGRALRPVELPRPEHAPRPGLLRGPPWPVCRTDLHIVDGEVPVGHLPLVLGHQIVGT